MVYARKVRVETYNVFFVKEMKQILISYSQVTERNEIVSVCNTPEIFHTNNKLFAIAWKDGRLYKLIRFLGKAEINLTSSISFKEKWHCRLGHLNFNCFNTLCKKIVEGLPNH